MEASSCVTEGGHQRLVKARIALGPDRSTIDILNDGVSLSEKLVELKRRCMDCIGSHLLAHNALAAADSVLDDDIDPFQEDISDGGDEESDAEEAKKAEKQQKKRNLKQK